MKLLIYDSTWPLYLPRLRQKLSAEWSIQAGSNDPEWLLKQLPDTDALIALTLPGEALPAAGNLKLFLFPGAGVMQSAAALPEGCALSNVFEHEIPIAEYVMMTILMHVTGIAERDRTFRQGRWEGNGRVGGEPHAEAYGKTIGIVGYGHIGRAVAERAAAFGMRVQAIRRSPGCSQPDEAAAVEFRGGPRELSGLLSTSDFVVIACPLTEETRDWIGEKELRCLRPDALLINVARAEIVREEPLYRALKERWFAGAALDVWYQYPSSTGEVMRGSRYPFQDLENVVMTPHFSAWTAPMIERRMNRIAENLRRLELGLPADRVVGVGTWRPR